MLFRSFLTVFSLFAFVCTAQDRMILNNGDTLKGKITRYDNSTVEYQLNGETISQVTSTVLVSSITLSSGRIVKPEVLETKKITPVFGFYKGSVVVSPDDNSFGLPHLRSAVFDGMLLIDEILGRVKISGAMTGASLAIFKHENRPMGDPQRVTVEFYAFSLPSPNYIKSNIIGKSFKLLMLDSYMLGQSELLSMINKETIQHSIEFSEDGKIIEDGRFAGNFIVNGDAIELKYQYANKKGKLKVWDGIYKVGSFNHELIQLYSANGNFTYFQNIILKPTK